MNVTTPALISSPFTVPANVYYVQFSMNWKAEAYVSSYFNAYYVYGYTEADRQRDLIATGLSTSAYRAAIASYSGLSNLASETIRGFYHDAQGVLVSGHLDNRLVKSRIPVIPGSVIKFSSPANSAYAAEYDINGKFTLKGTITPTSTYTVGANTHYVDIGYYSSAVDVPDITYVVKPTITKSVDSIHADNADAVYSSKFLKNVSFFSTTLATGTPSDLAVSPDSNGFILTAITTNNNYATFQLSKDILANEKYQITVEYELLELNCTNVTISTQAFFASSAAVNVVVTGEQIGIPNTLTNKTVIAAGTIFNCAVKAIPAGSKIDPGLAYYAKVLIKNISVVTYLDAFENLQNIERVIGSIPVGTKYFGEDTLSTLYEQYSTSSNFQGYAICRLDNVENTTNLINKSFNISSAVPSLNQNLRPLTPPAISGLTGYFYVTVEVTLNSLNGDYFNLTYRAVGDETMQLTRADIGKKKTFKFVQKTGVVGTIQQFLLIETNRIFTANVSNTGLDGTTPSASITLNGFSCYFSQKFLPTSYHGNFFNEYRTEDFLLNYVKEPVQEVVINAYGDSITEHNYAKYIAAEGYDFKINIYGLRSTLSDINGTGTGACNADKYGVMTNTADVVMPLFGTHDWGKPTPVGSIGTLDKNTYIGAYEFLIQGLINKYPGKIIIPVSITPRNLTNNDNEFFNGQTSTGIKLRDYVNALRDLCDHYGLPFVDAFAASGANPMTMTGHPNLYNPATTADNTLIDATGVSSSNTGYFTSDFMDVVQGFNYGTPTGCFFIEYNGSAFIRRSPASMTKLYMHPNTTRVKVCVSKSETLIAGTLIGVGPSRFWFAEQTDAYMPDRIHPSPICQARIAAEASKVLKQVLDARRMDASYQATIYNNAD
jgi:hypothetical protein